MLFGRFLFHTSIPHASRKIATISRRNTAGWAGCYYVFTQNWSIGFQRWISASFWDVPVRPDGGFNLVQARRMELKGAFTSTLKAAASFFRGWVICGRGRQRARISSCERTCEWEQAHQMATNYTWQSFPTIGSWLSSMQRPHQCHTSFLVLEGPSVSCKTEYVRGLCRPSATLELNADSMQAPYLREFDPEVHKVMFSA